jgi:hypothetical protein
MISPPLVSLHWPQHARLFVLFSVLRFAALAIFPK